MRKIYLLITSVLILFNCSNDVTFNSPAFQGQLDGTFWKATGYTASVDDNGFLTITGSTTAQTVSLTIPSVVGGTYTLGDVTSMEARVVTSDGTTYLATSDGTLAAHLGEGQIILNRIGTDNGFTNFTGTFWFNAYSIADNSINFNEGTFFQIPLLSGSIPAVVYTCGDGQTESAAALANYLAASTSEFIISADFESTCATYKLALENQRVYCGDVSGNIQAFIDSLGDCMFNCSHAISNVNTARTAFEAATASNYIETCNNYTLYLNEQIMVCGDASGGIQMIIDMLNCNDSDGDGLADILEDVDGDGDLTNDDTDSDLNPNYLDDDDDNDGILTNLELMFDEDGNPVDTDNDNIPNYIDADDDNDGILTINEDLNMDGDVTNDDTDGDGIPNYLDQDDDGDSLQTRFEDINFDGNPTNDDTDGDGTPNYLDIDDDGDSVYTIFENPDPNGNGNPSDAQNFDGDMLPDFLDNDDDGDGILTINENPDPNGDGDPSDAQDSDADTFPDYLDV